jgi:hypothetical protein
MGFARPGESGGRYLVLVRSAVAAREARVKLLKRIALCLVTWVIILAVLRAALIALGVDGMPRHAIEITTGLAYGWYFERILVWVNNWLKKGVAQ